MKAERTAWTVLIVAACVARECVAFDAAYYRFARRTLRGPGDAAARTATRDPRVSAYKRFFDFDEPAAGGAGDAGDDGTPRATRADDVTEAAGEADRAAAAGVGAVAAAPATAASTPLVAVAAADEELAPGVVLLAPPSEYNHFLRQQLVLLVEHDDETGSVGVILDKQTTLTIGEAAPGAVTAEALERNALFMGGEDGGHAVLMVHGVEGLAGAKPLGDGSGFFVGGVKAASNAVAEGDARAEDFKFFFNTLKWSANELRDGLLRHADGSYSASGWVPLRLAPTLALRQGGSAPATRRGASSLWSDVRRLLRENGVVLRKRDAPKGGSDEDDIDEDDA